MSEIETRSRKPIVHQRRPVVCNKLINYKPKLFSGKIQLYCFVNKDSPRHDFITAVIFMFFFPDVCGSFVLGKSIERFCCTHSLSKMRSNWLIRSFSVVNFVTLVF